ncbi:hypothetical protein ACFOEW_11025 [Alteromonas oceani]|uniref:Uncharacterized protein n=1 Tax=Alteromonas oceani TaxID=2071609 RepID=A0ABV7JW89_9ALTE
MARFIVIFLATHCCVLFWYQPPVFTNVDYLVAGAGFEPTTFGL